MDGTAAARLNDPIAHTNAHARFWAKFAGGLIGGIVVGAAAGAAAVAIIGTGGVRTGRDAFEHILCGASMVQIGTILHQEGPEAFTRITKELQDIMSEKGYQSLEDFRGKLQYLS